jgi:hypothetical protein
MLVATLSFTRPDHQVARLRWSAGGLALHDCQGNTHAYQKTHQLLFTFPFSCFKRLLLAY